jgi:7-cyano-7-deazaguanine synthase
MTIPNAKPNLTNQVRSAVVLLSGGLDSTTVLAIAKSQGFSPIALSFDYGQKNRFEIQTAKAVAEEIGVEQHFCVTIDLAMFGGSSLTTAEKVESNRSFQEIGKGVPSTYVPARNTLFLSYALALADSRGIKDIFIGVNALDTSGYPDCTPAFISAFEDMANIGTKTGIQAAKTDSSSISVHAPLQYLDKKGIVELGLSLGVDYSLTSTCYQPLEGNTACGVCDACMLRQRGFHQAGLSDPASYATRLPFEQSV